MKKKLLSALLAAGMLFTMAPAVAMAEPAQQTSESQIVNSSSEMTSSEVVTKDGVDVVKINKSIAGTDTENEFEITLDVETTENLKEIPQKADAAVVLVIDNSTSMNQLSGNEKPGKENETRLVWMRQKRPRRAFLTVSARQAVPSEWCPLFVSERIRPANLPGVT